MKHKYSEAFIEQALVKLLSRGKRTVREIALELIRYVSPQQRHAGEDHAILGARHALYRTAKERHPARWSGNTRNWQP
ncbi:MAG: hypothetical protein RIR45_947 [Pseudomonadota bacterium]|jgi:hypothetical protein